VYDVLARHLADCNPAMRRRTAEALGSIPNPGCVTTLIEMLDGDDDETVWRAAYSLYLLARSGLVPVDDVGAAEPLKRMLSRKNGHLLRGAALALGAVAAPGTAGHVIPLLFDKRGFVRSSAAWALGKIGDGQAVRPLRAALRDGQSAVRFRAAGALGELGSKAAIEPLRVALKDRNDSVRQAAAMAICRILEKLLTRGDVPGIGDHE
jgi:HEAT repeat protein